MGTGLRRRRVAARAWVAVAGLLAGMMVVAVPSAEAAAAPGAVPSAISTAPGDQLGQQVAVSGAVAVVGAPGFNDGRGAVYVFARSGKTWRRQAMLHDPLRHTGEEFGLRVAVSSTRAGTFVLVGAPQQGTPAQAYVFTRSGATWSRQARLADPHGADGDNFGFSVALSGTRVLVGAPFKAARHCGTAFEYMRSGKRWHERAQVVNPGCSRNDQFGSSVALSGTTALIGAPGKDKSAGAVYVQTLP